VGGWQHQTKNPISTAAATAAKIRNEKKKWP
jgi:hypothetical protein